MDPVTGAPAWVLPDESVPVRLMNTVWADRYGVHDALSTTDGLSLWLRHVAGVDDAPSSDELLMVHRLRDGLRRLAAHCTGDTRPGAGSSIGDMPDAVALVNDVALAAIVAPQLHLDAGVLRRETASSASPVSTALAGIATQAMTLLTEAPGSLRACHAPGCVLYFVKDHPRREWCSVGCGNRARAARHYRRHRHPA